MLMSLCNNVLSNLRPQASSAGCRYWTRTSEVGLQCRQPTERPLPVRDGCHGLATAATAAVAVPAMTAASAAVPAGTATDANAAVAGPRGNALPVL